MPCRFRVYTDKGLLVMGYLYGGRDAMGGDCLGAFGWLGCQEETWLHRFLGREMHRGISVLDGQRL